MNYKEIVPIMWLKKFDALCLHNEYLRQNKEVQEQILCWAADMLTEARERWGTIHATTIAAVVEEDRRAQAKKRGKARDNKYAPFREYFKQIQREKFDEALKNGCKLTANSFVEWFSANKANDMQIPYIEQNQKNKLRQLAQQNNRVFKKLLHYKA